MKQLKQRLIFECLYMQLIDFFKIMFFFRKRTLLDKSNTYTKRDHRVKINHLKIHLLEKNLNYPADMIA